MIELIEINEEQEKAFPYWFAVFGLEPTYTEDGSLRWLQQYCGTVWDKSLEELEEYKKTVVSGLVKPLPSTECRTVDDLVQVAQDYGGIVSIVECNDDDPIYCLDDDEWSSSSGVYFHILQMRFKSPHELNEAFQALSGFIGYEPELFKTGKYPDHFDDRSGFVPGFQSPLSFFETKSWLETNLDKAQQLYRN